MSNINIMEAINGQAPKKLEWKPLEPPIEKSTTLKTDVFLSVGERHFTSTVDQIGQVNFMIPDSGLKLKLMNVEYTDREDGGICVRFDMESGITISMPKASITISCETKEHKYSTLLDNISIDNNMGIFPKQVKWVKSPLLMIGKGLKLPGLEPLGQPPPRDPADGYYTWISTDHTYDNDRPIMMYGGNTGIIGDTDNDSTLRTIRLDGGGSSNIDLTLADLASTVHRERQTPYGAERTDGESE